MARKQPRSPGLLFNLKEWLTLEDAAHHLSIMFGEEVTVADVLRLAIDKRLTLSVDFVNHGTVRKGIDESGKPSVNSDFKAGA